MEGKGGGEALPKMEAGSHGDPVAHQDTILEALEVQRREQAKLIREQKVLLQELKEHNKQNQEVRGYILLFVAQPALFLVECG